MVKNLLKILTLIMITIGTLSCTHIFANQADIDPSFDTRLPIGFNSQVSAITLQSDEKIVVGGVFTNYKGVTSNYIIRLYADGNRDSSFTIGGGFNDAIKTLAIQSGGKIIAGGDFTSYSGVTANKIIRLNTNGSIDSSFTIGNGFNGTIKTLAIQNDGKILVGGDFTSYNGTTKNRIVRLNINGTIDTGFTIGVGFDGPVNTITIQSGGKILVGGDFTKYDGNKWSSIIRLNTDGTPDNSFIIEKGFDAIVNVLTIQSGGKILVGGDFTKYDGTTTNRIVRLNTGGTLDTGFTIGNGFDFDLNTLAIQSNGKILVGGAFTSYSGTFVNFITRLNANGTHDVSFDIGGGFNNVVNALAIKNNGDILVGGAFTAYSGEAANRIVRLNSDGVNDVLFNVLGGLNDTVWSVITQSDGKIVAGGLFTSYNGETTNNIIRLNTDGSNDSSFIIGGGFDHTIRTLAIQSDGKIVAGGDFTNYSGVNINRIIRLNANGTVDTGFTIGVGFDGAVNAITIQSGGKILVGGDFAKYNGTTRKRLLLLNTDGTIDTSFDIGGGFNNIINTLVIQSGGKILVGGNFTSYNGVVANRIVRLNTGGILDTGFTIGNGFDAVVNTLEIQSGGKILVGGNFTSYNGTTRNRIVRLNTDGSRDTSFSIGNGFDNVVNTLTTQSDGKIIVGGAFTNYNGTAINFIARLHTGGNRDFSFDIEKGFNDIVNSLTIQSGGKIFVGGDFTNYGGMAIGYLVALYGESNLIILPNSTNSNVLGAEFLNKGYSASAEGNEGIHRGEDDLSGSMSISLELTDGKIPVGFNLINQNIGLSLPKGLQFKKYDSATNYNGIISVPMMRSISNIHSKSVLAAFKVGSSMESIKLASGVALLGFSVPNINIGSLLQVYYSQDNGVSRYPQTMTFVTNNNGQPYASFPTNHFTDFAITLGSGDFTGSFVINNDAHSTPARDVTFNISTTPAAAYVRFSNDGFTRSGRQTYSTTPSWMLSTGVGMKTVYAEFDTDNDTGTSEVSINDTIYFYGSLGSLFIDNDLPSTLTRNVTLNLSGTPTATFMRFSNDGFTRSGRQTYNTTISRKLSPGTGEKMVYAEFDTNNNINTIEVAMNDTIMYTFPTTCDQATEIPENECQALIALYASTYGDNRVAGANGSTGASWIDTSHICTGDVTSGGWFGISCYDGHITAIDLRDNNLSGTLPYEIGNLSQLQNLYVSNNSITDLGTGFGNLSYLRTLDLGYNQLTGLPSDFENIGNLWRASNAGPYIYLNDNQLSLDQEQVRLFARLGVIYDMNKKLVPENLIGTTTVSGSVLLSGATTGGITFVTNGTLNISDSNNADNVLQLYLGGLNITTSNGSWNGNILPPMGLDSGDTASADFGESGIPAENESGINRTILGTLVVGSEIDSLIANGGYFMINFAVAGGNAGEIIKIYRSSEGSAWIPNVPDTECTLDSNLICAFDTNHLSYFTFISQTGQLNTGTFVINNDAASTTSQNITLNMSGVGITNMQFSNDDITRSSREAFATTKAWTLSAGTGTKTVYANFDTDNNTATIEAIGNDTINYIDVLTGCIGDSCADITLEILSNGDGYCDIGDSVDFGLTGYSASSRVLQSAFPTTSGNTPWFCNDLQGNGTTRNLSIQSSDLLNVFTNNPSHTIAGSNVSVKNPAAAVVLGACTPNAGSSLNARTPIGVDTPILGKIGGVGEVCKIQTSQVDLQINIPAYQAVGQYSGTLIITVPSGI